MLIFLLLSHPFTAISVAQVFMDHIFKLHEWWYNTSFHSIVQKTPYEIVYGQTPAVHVPYILGDCNVEALDRILNAREECLRMLKFHLRRAHDRMKKQANKDRVDRGFAIGDLVYVKLQPYRQQSVVQRTCAKLSPRYYGPFPVIARVGQVAYKLELPSQAKVHPIFHISLLKKHEGVAPVVSSLPDLDDSQQIRAEPVAVLGRKLVKKGNKAVVYVLV
ncbi:hypothetical protein RND81_06G163000 [Saponaria officinalis]|uniref:Tf2-1-like SH3-like domain-containing protein n=1 Tax=Saponaria officinalis TaxID=3572 RepID=A0AAW1KCH9_SAPOF